MTGIKARIRLFPGTDPTVAYDLEAVMAYQRKLWLGILAIGVAITAMPSVARTDLVRIGETPAASFVDLGAVTLPVSTPVDVVHGDAVPGANKSTTPTCPLYPEEQTLAASYSMSVLCQKR